MGRKNIVDLINKGYVEDADLYTQVYGTSLSPDSQAWVKSARTEIQANPQYKRFVDMGAKFQIVTNSLERESGTADISAINAFQRMVDEGVVREGDVALLQSAMSFKDKYLSGYQYNKLISGDKLPQNVRNEMAKIAQNIYDINKEAMEELVLPTYIFDAKTRNVPINMLIPEYRDSEEILANKQGFSTKDPMYQEIEALGEERDIRRGPFFDPNFKFF